MTDRVALDIGLCTLTLQLTLNEALLIQAMLNNSKRTRLCLRLDLNNREPADAEFVVSAVNAVPSKVSAA
jgi:hypothetical protein